VNGVLALLALALASTGQAQPPAGDPPALPEGHPPTGEALPEGHPPTGEALPEGHPPTGEALPEGHPPTGEALPEGHPPTGEALPEGHPPTGAPAGDPHAGGMNIGALFRPPSVASDAPSSDVPIGTIRVEVVDEADRPVADAEVELGTMSGGRAAARRPARTDAAGIATYDGLVTGSGTAYRVYVNHEGARYASSPIVLMPEAGHRVRIQRLPVSHDDRQLLQFVAQTIVEIRDDRLHVVVQSQLVNAGETTYVFPPGGLRIRLPEGFLAFSSPAAMNEIEITEVEGYGVSFAGSLPPGMVTAAYGFDLPYDTGFGTEGAEAEIAIANPFRTMRYRIITDAPEGLELDPEGFPRPERFDSDGRALLGTELMRRPGDPPLEEVRFTLRGLPGPGPTRWLAVAGAVLVLGIGVRLGRRERDDRPARARARAALEERERDLIEQAALLRAELDAGEIGPETCQSELEAIVHELANVLMQKEKLSAPGVAAGPSPAARPRGVLSEAPEPRRNRKKAGSARKSKEGKSKGPRPPAGA
jgi:hypothetical protein